MHDLIKSVLGLVRYEAIIPFMVISAFAVLLVEGFEIHLVYAQTNISKGNMTSAMTDHVPIRGLFETHLTVSDLRRSIGFYRLMAILLST